MFVLLQKLYRLGKLNFRIHFLHVKAQNNIGDTMFIPIIRTTILYVAIIIAVRLMGKRQISDLQTTELVVTMLISDIASIAVENTAQPLLSGVIPMAVLVVCEIVLSAAMIKNTKLRKIICGKPIIVINNGKIQQSELKRLRMSVEDLSEELRQQGVFSFKDVAFAIVETNGKTSVMKKPQRDTPTLSDLKLKAQDNGIEAVVISDGTLSKFSMKLCEIDEKFICDTLKKENMKLEDVFIMTADKTKKYTIVKRSDNI